MNCPRCGNKEQENNKVCMNCGLNLRINCPQCGSSNILGQKNCTNCSEKLIIFCPNCKAANHPKSKNCRKCNNPFVQVQAEPQNDYAVISIELINLSNLKTRIEPETLVNLVRRFYQTTINEAKYKEEKARRITDQLLAIEFKKSNPDKMSAICAMAAAQRIMEEIKVINNEIKDKAELKVKIGISITNDGIPKNFCQLERTVASSGEIIVNTDVYSLISDLFDFEEVKPSIEGEEEVFYKLHDQTEAEKAQASDEEDQISQEEILRRKRIEALQAKERKKRGIEASGSVTNVSQEDAYDSITNILNRVKTGHIISLSGLDGVGKTAIINSIRQNIPPEQMIFLMSQCQPINRVIPFGFFQDLFKTMLNMPPLILDVNEAKKTITGLLETLSVKNRQAEKVLQKIILHEFQSTQISELLKNRDETFEAIKSILSALTTRGKIVLVVDDIEYIDNASLDLIKELINDSFPTQNCCMIAIHSTDTNINDYFPASSIDIGITEFIINPITREEAEKALSGMLNNQDILPAKLKDEICNKSKGLPLYIEQVMWLLFQVGIVYTEENNLKFNEQGADLEFPENLEEIIKTRITQLNEQSSDLFNIMLAASLFGQRFMPAIVQLMLDIDQQQFTEMLQALISNGIFINYDNNSFLFKHKVIWDTIYNHLLSAEQKIEYHKKATEVLKSYTKANGAVIALQAEMARHPEIAIEYWNQGAIEALSIGDIHAFTIAQKKVLSLLDTIYVPEIDKERLKQQIYEQIGKINYEINPNEVVEFLSNAIIGREKQGDIPQLIELTGYLAKSCELLGNYAGIVECVDKALASFDKHELPLEYGLLCYSKLGALYNLGKLEEVILLAKSTVIPILRDSISSKTTISNLSIMELQYIELDAEAIMVKALAVQGNKDTLSIADQVGTKAKENGYLDIEAQVKLTEALYKCLQGRVKPCSNVLNPMKEIIPLIKDNEIIRLHHNAYSILAKIFCGNYSQASQPCCQALEEAKEYREYNLYAIIKLLTAKILKESGKNAKARSLYNEIITYCSEHRMATGALLGWYLIAEIELEEGNIEASREIAQRASEVAQKADINNYYFMVLLGKILAETYITTEDFESAKMHIQKALELAKKMELYYLQSKLYLIYGKMFQKMIATSEDNKKANAQNSYKLYVTALQVAKMIENDHLAEQINKELMSLRNLCKAEKISIK